jgi:hypothetical protein
MGITVEDVKNTNLVLEAISKIIDIINAFNSPRSVVLEVQNLTSSPLRLVSHDHAEGGFAEPPSSEILPGQVNVFGSKSSGFASGTDGRVIYESNSGFLLHVSWKNPFAGANSSGAGVVGNNPPFEATNITGVGKQAAHMQYIVRPGVPPGLIVRKFEGEAGSASEIAAIKSGARELITAVITGSETLALINWQVDSNASLVRRLGDSGDDAGAASDIDIAQGRLFVTACRTGAGNLLLISWEVEADGEARRVRRRGDSRDQAGDARTIKIAALSDSLFVTAVQTGAGELKLITWELRADNSLTRTGDSGEQAGAVSEISLVRISPDTSGNHRVVTSVRAGDGELVLIGWSISTDGVRIRRLTFHDEQAGKADMIRSVVTSSGHLVTSMRAVTLVPGVGSQPDHAVGDLVLISWRIGEDDTITRLADSHGQAGEITGNSLMSRPGGVLSAVNSGGGLKLIAWRITAQGALIRAVDSGQQAGEAFHISLCQEPLAEDAPIVTAVSTASGNLKVIAWKDGIQPLIDPALDPGLGGGAKPILV